jgi:glucose-6-phosphate 1-epimerase
VTTAVRPDNHQNQPCQRLILPSGDTVLVALHGAQVLSWQTGDGRERMYLSPKAIMDGKAAIRGGVPVCFPQFNTRGNLPKHGFARNVAWQSAPSERANVVALTLTNDAQTQAFTDSLWPHQFAMRLELALAPQSLHISLQVHNTGSSRLPDTRIWPCTACQARACTA